MPAPLTVPEPATARESAAEEGGAEEASVKVAVQVTDDAGMVKVVPEEGQTLLPLQPENVEPAVEAAESVTVAPAA